MTGTFVDVDAPNTNWRGGSEDPLPGIFGRWPYLGGVYRLLSARELDGHARTDAGWLRPGTRAFTKSGWTYPFNYWPHWKRGLLVSRLPPTLSAWATLGVAEDALNLSDLFHYHSPWWMTWQTPAALAVPAVAWWGWATYETVSSYKHRRDYVRPLADALRHHLGVAPKVAAHQWVRIPRGYLPESREPVVIDLPEGFAPTDGRVKEIESIVAAKLGLYDPDFTWKAKVGRRRAQLIAEEAPLPPEFLSWEDLAPIADAAPEMEPVVGLGVRDRVVRLDLEKTYPHVMITGQTNAGKSVLARSIVSHFLRHGSMVVILDMKGDGYQELRDIPGVLYVTHVPDMHDTLLWLQDELLARKDMSLANRDIGTRLVVLAEEMNSTIGPLRNHWLSIKPSGASNVSPAIQATAMLAAMGRALKFNVLWVTQSATARAYGGPETRENFGVRLAGAPSKKQWDMVAPGIPMPQPSGVQGRWHLVLNGHATPVQVAYMTDEQAAERAITGTPSPDPGELLQAWRNTRNRRSQPIAAPILAAEVVDTMEMVTIAEIAQMAGVAVGTIPSWRSRYADFPSPVQVEGRTQYFDRAAVAAWLASRNGER